MDREGIPSYGQRGKLLNKIEKEYLQMDKEGAPTMEQRGNTLKWANREYLQIDKNQTPSNGRAKHGFQMDIEGDP